MSADVRSAYPASRPAAMQDESDVEEEALVNNYKEQVHFDDGMSELDRTTSLGGGSQAQAIQAQLAAAATPLEFQATLETKFASYDNYCSLFHFILNSDGPVDLEVPSVCVPNYGPHLSTLVEREVKRVLFMTVLTGINDFSTIGHGM